MELEKNKVTVEGIKKEFAVFMAKEIERNYRFKRVIQNVAVKEYEHPESDVVIFIANPECVPESQNVVFNYIERTRELVMASETYDALRVGIDFYEEMKTEYRMKGLRIWAKQEIEK